MISAIRVTFEPFNKQIEHECGFAVIASRFKGQWMFVQHKKRSTFELPGGRRETGEHILATAKRELYEKTGALEFLITPVDCLQSV